MKQKCFFMLLTFLMLFICAPVHAEETEAEFTGYYSAQGTYKTYSLVKSYTPEEDITDLPKVAVFKVNGSAVYYQISGWNTENLTDSYGSHYITPLFSEGTELPAEIPSYNVFQSPLNTSLTNHAFEVLPKPLVLGKWTMFYLDNPNYTIADTGLMPDEDPSFGWQTTEYSNFRESEAGQPYYRQMEINYVSNHYATSATGLVTGQLQESDETIPGFSGTSTEVAEINAREVSSLYQDLNTFEGGIINYQFYHGGREISGNPSQYMALIIGPSHFSENENATNYGPTSAYTSGENGNNTLDLFHKVYFAALQTQGFSDWLNANQDSSNDYGKMASLLAKIDFSSYNSPVYNGQSWDASLGNLLITGSQREKINLAFVAYAATLDQNSVVVSYRQEGWSEAEDWTVRPNGVESNRWSKVSGNYTIPDGQTSTVFAMMSLPSNGVSSYEGNLVTQLYCGISSQVTFLPNAANVNFGSDGGHFPDTGIIGTGFPIDTIPVTGLTDHNGEGDYSVTENPTRQYYTFSGWSTNRFAKAGDSDVYTIEDIQKMHLEQDTYFYAIWTPIDDYGQVAIQKKVYGLSIFDIYQENFKFKLTLTDSDGNPYRDHVVLSFANGTILDSDENPDIIQNGVIQFTLHDEEIVDVLTHAGVSWKIEEELTEEQQQEFLTQYSDLTRPYSTAVNEGVIEENRHPYILCYNMAYPFVNFIKYSPEGSSLKGAVYQVYKDYDPQTNTLSNLLGSATSSGTNNNSDAPYFIDKDGNKVRFDPMSYYYIKEVTAPVGYLVDEQIYRLEFKLNYYTYEYIPLLKIYDQSWELPDSTYPSAAEDSIHFTSTLFFMDYPQAILPYTGNGTEMLFAAFGLIGIGLILFAIRERRKPT